MSVNSVNGLALFDSQKLKYMNSVGVDNEGNPVYFDPKKCKKQPNCVWTKPLTPEEKEKIMEYMKDPKKHFKPGIFDPEAQKRAEERKSTLLKVGGVALAAILAFVFRGKLKTGAQKIIKEAAPYAKKALEYVKNTKVFDTVKKAAGSAISKAKAYAPKVMEQAKNVYTKYAKPVVNKVLAFLENIKPTVAKK